MYITCALQEAGYSHRHCQDRFRLEHSENALILAVADGHGGAAYTRSGLGARFACAAAVEVLGAMDCVDVPAAIKDRYDALVAKHLTHRPLEDWQKAHLKGDPDEAAYGTTLLAARITEDGTWLYQLGDGHILALDADGSLLPTMPEDLDCFLNRSSSLCYDRKRALRKFRTLHFPQPVAAVVLMTDGCDGGTCQALLAAAEEAPAQLLEQMLRATASGDDQTCVLAVSDRVTPEFREAVAATVQSLRLEAKRRKRLEREEEERRRQQEYEKRVSQNAAGMSVEEADRYLKSLRAVEGAAAIQNTDEGGNPMPVLYTQIPIQAEGMVSATAFDLPGDGRKVFFDIYPGGSFRKKVYISVDGEFRPDAFANGTPMQTPVRGIERVFANGHDAYAIVVDRTEVHLPTIGLDVMDVPVVFADGRSGTLKIRGELHASIFPEDPGLLASEFADGTTTDPENAAANCLKAAVMQDLLAEIEDAVSSRTPMDAVGLIPRVAFKLSGNAVDETQRRLPWCRVSACEVSLTVENLNEVISNTNVLPEFTMETKRKIVAALLDTFGADPLPAAVGQILSEYIKANPGLPGDEFHKLCSSTHALWKRNGIDGVNGLMLQLGMTTNLLGGC